MGHNACCSSQCLYYAGASVVRSAGCPVPGTLQMDWQPVLGHHHFGHLVAHMDDRHWKSQDPCQYHQICRYHQVYRLMLVLPDMSADPWPNGQCQDPCRYHQICRYYQTCRQIPGPTPVSGSMPVSSDMPVLPDMSADPWPNFDDRQSSLMTGSWAE
ncbi:hypothetical protein BYT27DRAFT_7212608 [Phlegmacium glaucopus]|nr:hypothetical protein BYT27DRAFT_7212608 [Phlegmacium glaucopus]